MKFILSILLLLISCDESNSIVSPYSDSTLEIFKRINYSNNFDIMYTLKLSNLIQNYGFKSITEYHYTMESIIKEKGYRTDITLLDLYNIIPINVHFKVINITEDRIEYLNKDNSPDLLALSSAEKFKSSPSTSLANNS